MNPNEFNSNFIAKSLGLDEVLTEDEKTQVVDYLVEIHSNAVFFERPKAFADFDPKFKQSEVFFLLCLRYQPTIFRYFGKPFKNSLRVARVALEFEPHYVQFLGKELKHYFFNKTDFIAKDGTLLKHADASKKATYKDVDLAVSASPAAVQFVSPKVDHYKDLVLKAVTKEGKLLQYAHGLQDDPVVVAAALDSDPHAVKWLPKPSCLTSLQLSKMLLKDPLCYNSLPPQLSLRKSVILYLLTTVLPRQKPETLRYGPDGGLTKGGFYDLVRWLLSVSCKYLSPAEKKKVIVPLLYNFPRLFASPYCPRCKPPVFRTWLLRHLYNKDAPMIALEFLIVHHNYLREDREIVSLILQRDGLSLEHAAEDLKNDEALVDVAVRQHGKSLLYAHERFRNDESMIALAFKTYPRIVKSMSDDLKRNKRFVSSLMDSNPGAIEYLDKRNRSDKDLMLQVCKKGGVELLRCASSALKSDKDFAKDVIEYDLDGSGFVRGSHDIFETMTLTDLVQGESTYRWLLSHCPEDKKEIMYTALHRDPWVYLSLPEHTRCMPAVMMHAFSQDWSRFIPNMMRKLDQYHKAQSGLGFSFTGLSVPPLYHYVANRLLSELIPKCRDFIAAERKKHGNSFHNPYRLLRELLSDVLRNQQVLLKNSCLPLNGHLTELNFCKYSDLFFGLQIPLNAILEGVALGISSTVVSIGCLSLSILRYLNTYEMIDLLKSLSLNHNFQRYVVDRSVAKSDVTYRRPLVSLFSQSAGVGSHTGKRSLDVVVATRDSMQELGSADSRRGKRCKIESAGSALSNQSGLSL